ncbi:MAG: poly-gamma-glutamate system protein [Calditrichaeota bacterium]|nr:poly-gamma-glutamate system protein [Calditrichota bacterium]
MFKPSLKSIWTLLVLALTSYGLYTWAYLSRTEVRQDFYEEKLAAARQMEHAMQVLKEWKAPNASFVDDVNDPWNTLLIGQKFSQITTVEGSLLSKQGCLNPNVAAVVVDLMKQTGVKEGDRVAVCMTGSFPGLNLAVYSACRVLKLEPVFITSVSSSWFGANDPEFTWLDMERVLKEKGIFPWVSSYASIGGADDRGQSLSPEGRELIRKAITRNGVPYLDAPDLDAAVQMRIESFQNQIRNSPKGYDLYVNVGGGVASLGHEENRNIMPTGVARNVRQMEFQRRAVLHFFADAGVPVINLLNVRPLLKRTGVPYAPLEKPEVGDGEIFVTERHNMKVVLFAVLVMTILVLIVIRYDLRMQRLVDTDQSDEML